MKNGLIEEVLACPALPSLPAVALRVIDLTSDPNVKMHELAETITNDQGLAAKILKTVNSSYYALRTPCGSIQKALVMLGLSPVKTLALGFSLVSSMDSRGDSGFDYVAYWRRGLYTGVAAKAFAEVVRSPISEEAFLAGLLQDIGQMAMYRALQGRYLKVMAKADGDHRKLAKAELEELDTQHAEVGAMLAQRWKLPADLTMAVRYHERPTAAPPETAMIVKFVALGQCVHDALTDRDPREAMRRTYERAQQWLELGPTPVDELVKRVAEQVKEVSRLFKLDTGVAADAEEILKIAEERRAVLEGGVPLSPDGDGLTRLVARDADVDPLTGVLSRQGFDSTVRHAFQAGFKSGSWTSIVQCIIDSYGKALPGDRLELADEGLLSVSGALTKQFEPRGGVVCRLSKDLFAVVITGADQGALLSMVAAFRGSTQAGAMRDRGLLVSVSSASAGPGTVMSSPTELVIAATKALQSERKSAGQSRAA